MRLLDAWAAWTQMGPYFSARQTEQALSYVIAMGPSLSRVADLSVIRLFGRPSDLSKLLYSPVYDRKESVNLLEGIVSTFSFEKPADCDFSWNEDPV
ncbi:hypothetical protein [Mesorhizobium sp. M0276]|uniref:hypothetical protein n=1 Tax=Mesorhizobium sp. M0276 TaxID=2956928 RepID=UPI0033377149